VGQEVGDLLQVSDLAALVEDAVEGVGGVLRAPDGAAAAALGAEDRTLRAVALLKRGDERPAAWAGN
jgi:hypothetical protein